MATVLVHQSKTRRKACTGCKIKSLDCIYVNDARRDTRQKELRRSSQGSTIDSEEGIAVAQFSMDPHESGLDSQTYHNTNTLVLDYQNPQLDQDITSWNSVAASFPLDIPLPTTNFSESLDPHFLSMPIDILPSPYSSLQYPLRTTLSPTQASYLVTQLKSFISAFALHSHNSFIYQLYSSDQSLHTPYTDALSICALHTLSSPQTFSILDSKLSNLVASSERDYWSSCEWLLAVQVFVLYQIIRLWSSNERQIRNAERQIPLLMQWTNQLQIEYVGLLAEDMDSRSPAGNRSGKSEMQDCHKRWVLMESMRRTVMISVILQCLYGESKDGYIGGLLPLLFGLPVSVGAGRAWDVLSRRIHDEQVDSWEDQSEINVEFGEVYTYEYWSEGWVLGVIEGGERDQEIYERMLLVACPKTGASERWGTKTEVASGGTGTAMGRFAMGLQL
ncbi:hypothetical protein SBOR_1862 [Sclerotinia borealis F-4128]|uniref:Zn(2)-C6 fungal-type domain-containing protein n=1 Tax=Sclerotinia borealis (strain F-4128) TaxID=1432307 RepID=W9CLR7_SCLBF|nr:hypothetical protein SBOR_1862 [Sclerotinia borealis F-4128]